MEITINRGTLSLVEGDITKQDTDAIVNAANKSLKGVPILVEGLRRLEYRGYDSAGLAVINGSDTLTRVRTPGKVAALDELLENDSVQGSIGIAHTRWATHGVPNEANAHPHVCRDEVAVVHNGIIENYTEIRAEQERLGYEFHSDTDTEVIATRIHHYLGQGATLVDAVRSATGELEGAYAIGVVNARQQTGALVYRLKPEFHPRYRLI